MATSFNSGANFARATELVDYNAAYTAMFWVNATAGTFHGTYFCFGVVDVNSDTLFAADASLTPYLEIFSASASINGARSSAFGATGYNHVAVVRISATSIKVVINGVSDSARTHTTVSARAASSGQYLGNTSNGAYNLRSSETISDFYLYDAALTDAEIQDQMNFAYPRRTNNLREWLPLNGGSARNVDFSGNGRNYTEIGTINTTTSLILARPPLLYLGKTRSPYHPDTLDYLSRLTNAGGTISRYNTDLLDTKIRYAYARSLRGATDYLKYWLSLNLTESFTGCLVPVYDDGVGNATNVNFVAADWSSTLGLTGNGIDKYLNSNYSLSTSLGTFTLGGRSDFFIGVSVTNNVPNAALYKSLVSTGTGAGSLLNAGIYSGIVADNTFYGNHARNGLDMSAAALNAFVLMNIPSESSRRMLTNGSLQHSIGTTTTTIFDPVNSLFFFARNSTGTPNDHSESAMTNFTMGFGLTTAQETALYNMLNITQPYYSSIGMLLAC